jgi:hypothetical protein
VITRSQPFTLDVSIKHLRIYATPPRFMVSVGGVQDIDLTKGVDA